MPDVQKSQRVEVRLCYFPDALSMCYRRAANAQRAFHTRLGHATEAKSHKIGKRMWRTLTCLTRAPKCVHSEVNAPVTRVELIRNVKDIHTRHARLLENFLSMFKMFEPKRAESAHRPLATCVNVHPAYTKRTQAYTKNAHVARF